MFKYFDIPKDKIVLEIGVTEVSIGYSVEQFEQLLGFSGLREVDKLEFNHLMELYTSDDKVSVGKQMTISS